jgi:arsenite methyltransferase
MNKEEIKNAVQKKYSKIAVTASSCCGPNCGCNSDDAQVVSVLMNDLYKDVDERIVAAADQGLGCGTPTAFADMKKGMTVLDLGSGAGIDVFLAARQVGPTGKAIGLDMTEKMLERAMANREKLGISNAEFRKGEIEHMPVDSNSVDRIISNCVINLVPDKRKAFAEMYRVLKRGGKITVSDVVSIGTIPEDIASNVELWAGCVAGALDKEEYVRIVHEAGFVNITIVAEKEYDLDRNLPFGLVSITLGATK